MNENLFSFHFKLIFRLLIVCVGCWKQLLSTFISIEGLIELRGGVPLLEMLPDVFEWPIAVDNWETNYGKISFSSAALNGCHVQVRKSVFLTVPPSALQAASGDWRMSLPG